MSAQVKDRHLLGAGAAACAVCCAPPVLALLGVAGVGLSATLATVAFAGLMFGLVVLSASPIGVWASSRGASSSAAPCTKPNQGPVDLTIRTAPPDTY